VSDPAPTESTHTETVASETVASETGRVAERLLAKGTSVGRYVIVDWLGAGGMGSVYVAYDTELARRVAVKILRRSSDGTDGRARMLREAQAMARLSHPNVVAVFDVGTFEDRVFLAMEYVEGTTLSETLRENPPWRDALALLKAAGRGLAAAHSAGIVHRDFKPANVLLGKDGRVVVADFGIARAHEGGESPTSPGPAATSHPRDAVLPATPSNKVDAARLSSAGLPPSLSTPLTEADAVLGTTGYISPERAIKHRDDARSDQFSFCVTLYRALYARSPFPHTDFETYRRALLSPALPAPPGTPVPRWVHAVIARGLSLEPLDRFSSMAELLDALDRDPSRRRKRWLAAAGAVGVVSAVAFGAAARRQAIVARCHAGESLIAATWDAERREQVGAGIATTGVPFAQDFAARTQRLLDKYAADWAGTYREASEATLIRGDENAVTLQRRLGCLDAAREEFGALVTLLSRADGVIAEHALSAVYGLRSPRACLERAALLSTTISADAPSERSAAIVHAVAEAQALSLASKCEEAATVAARTLPDARALPRPHSVADLLKVIADCTNQTQDAKAARERYEEVLGAAEAAGDDSLAANVAASIAFGLSNSLGDQPAAERWLGIAKGIRAREGEDERADADILEAEQTVLSAGGHPDRSLALSDRLIPLLERIYGASHPKLAAAINNRACDLGAVGKQGLAVKEFRRSIAMQELLYGPNLVALSVDYNNVGSTLTELGRYDEAREAIVHALALAAPLGPSNPRNVVPLASLAVLSDRVGDWDETLRTADRGIAIVEATEGAETHYLPCLLVERGRALLARGAPEEARRSCQRALREQENEGIIGPDKIYQDDALACLGAAELGLGRTNEALTHLERSVSFTTRQVPADLARARFTLARALVAAKREPDRARTLAETARDELRKTPGGEREASEVARWIEATSSVAEARR
jgi:tetratricopeptide (TPR) repeat protein/predicted Ser/Thr protein kinase